MTTSVECDREEANIDGIQRQVGIYQNGLQHVRTDKFVELFEPYLVFQYIYVRLALKCVAL